MSASRTKRVDISLRPLWNSAIVGSNSDGTMTVRPTWKAGAGGGLSRLAAAYRLEELIKKHLKRRRK